MLFFIVSTIMSAHDCLLRLAIQKFLYVSSPVLFLFWSLTCIKVA